MPSITDIPLDVWATVMLHLDEPARLVQTFDRLFLARTLNVPIEHRLDAFWTLMSLARLESCRREERIEQQWPDSSRHVDTFSTLLDLGVPEGTALAAVQQSDGYLYSATEMLGW